MASFKSIMDYFKIKQHSIQIVREEVLPLPAQGSSNTQEEHQTVVQMFELINKIEEGKVSKPI